MTLNVIHKPVERFPVNGVMAPSLEDLKTKKCSNEELQAALVNLIEMFNSQTSDIAKELKNLHDCKENRQWRASL